LFFVVVADGHLRHASCVTCHRASSLASLHWHRLRPRIHSSSQPTTALEMQEPTSAAEMSSNRIQPVSVLPVSVPPETSQSVYIRVPTATLQTLSPGQQPSGHLYLIEGTLEEFTKFAGTTVDWILWIAHLLCDPLGIGHIFTHTTGTLLDWQTSDRNSTWREVIMVIHYSLVSMSLSPPTPSYFPRSVIGKVVQLLLVDHNPLPPPSTHSPCNVMLHVQ
jgi:hypothetical protein